MRKEPRDFGATPLFWLGYTIVHQSSKCEEIQVFGFWWVPDIVQTGALLPTRLHFFADGFPGNKKLDPVAFAILRLDY